MRTMLALIDYVLQIYLYILRIFRSYVISVEAAAWLTHIISEINIFDIINYLHSRLTSSAVTVT